jgi:hypothetical protein
MGFTPLRDAIAPQQCGLEYRRFGFNQILRLSAQPREKVLWVISVAAAVKND